MQSLGGSEHRFSNLGDSVLAWDCCRLSKTALQLFGADAAVRRFGACRFSDCVWLFAEEECKRSTIWLKKGGLVHELGKI